MTRLALLMLMGFWMPPSNGRAQSGSAAETAQAQDAASGGEVAGSGLSRIATGTIVGNAEQARWNAVVLVARPRLASGDVQAIPSVFRDIATSFILTIMATVEEYREPASGQQRYRLAELGFGFSREVDGHLTVIGADDYDQLDVRLGMIEQRVLAKNERQLDTVRLVARSTTLAMFDVPAIMYRDGKHQDFITRHLVWVDARSGRNSALVWLLSESAQGALTVVDEPLRLLSSGTREDRRIHVDASKFILGGIPTERSFALESLPPGKSIPWTEAARRYAADSTYDAQSMQALTSALNKAIK